MSISLKCRNEMFREKATCSQILLVISKKEEHQKIKNKTKMAKPGIESKTPIYTLKE